MSKIATVCRPTDPDARLAIADWGTHAPCILKVLDRAEPDTILELGSGDFSSILFHDYVTGVEGRHATTLENDPEWVKKMSWLRNPWHDLTYVPAWNYGPWQKEVDL